MPDRKQLAFSEFDGIGVIRADGTGRASLANLPRSRIVEIRWSPSGNLIAFETYCCEDTPTDEFDIWIMGKDGGGRTRLVANAGDFSWSPSSDRIAFVPQLVADPRNRHH